MRALAYTPSAAALGRSSSGGFVKPRGSDDLEEMVDRSRKEWEEAVTRSSFYLRGIAAKVRSMFSSNASVDRTPAAR